MTPYSGPRVVSIYRGVARGAPMELVPTAKLVVARGIEGDRFFGDGSKDRPVALIESEAIEAARRDYGVEFQAQHTRRNIVTVGVALNHLVGRTFRVGSVLLRGKQLCEPCAHLGSLTSETFFKALIHRGGLRASVLEDGEIRPGDAIVVLEAP